MQRLRTVAVGAAAVLILLSAGCSSAGGGASTDGAPSARRSSSRDLISREELDQGAFSDLEFAVRRLRPAWLRSRGGEAVKLYVDNISAGDLSMLTSIPVESVQEIRYINSRDATIRWGTGHRGGAIEVITRRGG